ncbi:hypothetical protein F4860DRAFT_490880 [Xylaria cubensis]|nr:hypothetical protein F4860DRAFT_490880 [Xylaria cubensis]
MQYLYCSLFHRSVGRDRLFAAHHAAFSLGDLRAIWLPISLEPLSTMFTTSPVSASTIFPLLKGKRGFNTPMDILSSFKMLTNLETTVGMCFFITTWIFMSSVAGFPSSRFSGRLCCGTLDTNHYLFRGPVIWLLLICLNKFRYKSNCAT